MVLRANKALASRPLWWAHARSQGVPASEMRNVAGVHFERVREMEVQRKRMADRFQKEAEAGHFGRVNINFI